MRTAMLIGILVSLMTAVSVSQVATGTPPFASFGGGPFDSINLGNSNIHFTVPMLSKPGRGRGFSYGMSYDSSIWYPAGVSGSQYWSPVLTWGWQGLGAAALGSVGNSSYTIDCYTIDHGIRIVTGTKTTYSSWSYTERTGTRHTFSGTTSSTTGTCTGASPTLTATAADGSNIILNVTGTTTAYITMPDGTLINPPGGASGSATMTDRNGNQISLNSAGTTFTDTLNQPVLTISGVSPNPVTLQYTAPSGQSAKYIVYYTTYTVATNFGASGIAEYGGASVALVDHITLPDSTEYTFTYEPTPSTPASGACTPLANTYSQNCVTGRIAKVTLPTGGSITYTYSAGSNGINTDGSAATITRAVSDGNTSNQWTYAHYLDQNGLTSTTVTDPLQNQTYYVFYGLFEVSRQIDQKINGTQTTLSNIYTCYNETGTFAWNTCSASFTLPFTRRTIFTQFPDHTGKESEVDEQYDASENVTERDSYDYGTLGSGAPGGILRKEVWTYSKLSQTLNGISQSFEVPIVDTIYNGGSTQYAKTTYGYDASITSTTNIPQHISVTGSHGLLTSVTSNVTSTATLQTNYGYYDTGVLKSITDVNSAATTLSYGSSYGGAGSCNGAFPTSATLPASLTWSFAWDANCTGGVMISQTDPNSETTYTNYTQDSYFWRPESTTDALSYVTSLTYSATTSESALNFNSNKSTVDVLTTLDGLGRTLYTQQKQGYGSGNFDSVQYAYDNNGRQYQVTMPYVAAAGQPATNPIVTTTTYDALNRPTETADGGSGSSNLTYTYNDVYQEIKPKGTGETNTKRKQLEYDGLGRLTSVCEITAGTTTWPGGTCAQAVSQTGYWTKYTYNPLGQITGVIQNAQSTSTQSRTYTYDQLGRLTYESNPEAGATNYYYDSNATCSSTSYNGDLVRKVDAVGNASCYKYDQLHRAMQITYSGGSNNTQTKCFVYDSATVNGASMSYAKGHLAEAYTTSGSSCPSSSKTTDLGFGYSQRGEPTDVYESTPNSGGYYHVNATYWAHGGLNAVSGIPGVPTIYYGSPQTDGSGLDGEGRGIKVTASGSGQTPVTGVGYTTSGTTQPIGSLTQVTFGSGDFDTFSYDKNTGRMTGYQFNVGSGGQAQTAVLNWNPNWTLQQLSITDTLNGSDTQTCTYTHDDMVRIASANCVNGSTNIWNQTFSFDPFGNITKSVPTGGTGIAFSPTYNTSSNRYSTLPSGSPTYDANGDLTGDGVNTYAFDADANAVTVDGVGVTYDALDRAVEQNRSGSQVQLVYGPGGGKLALMLGQTLGEARLPMPGGSVAKYGPSGLANYWHPDWLGSSRVETTPGQTVTANIGFAPYGETYIQSGQFDFTFTGSASADTAWGIYDFLYREYNPNQGRWVSPDPAGMGAVSPANPQTWNRYAYASNNPLATTDPLGLVDCPDYDCEDLPGDWGLFFPGTPGFIPSCWAYGPCGYFGESGASGFDFNYGASFDFGGDNGGTWSEWQAPMPTSPGQVFQSLWSDVLNLPSDLNCPQVGGLSDYICGGVSPIMDAQPNRLQSLSNCQDAAAQYTNQQLQTFDLNFPRYAGNNIIKGSASGAIKGIIASVPAGPEAIPEGAIIGTAKGGMGAVAKNAFMATVGRWVYGKYLLTTSALPCLWKTDFPNF